MQLCVCTNEIFANAGIHLFNQSLNPCILDYVTYLFERSNILNTLECLRPFFKWRMQRMRHFVSHKHIIHRIGHILPHRKNQATIFNIERSSFGRCIMLDSDVFGSHTFSKYRLGRFIDFLLQSHTYMIHGFTQKGKSNCKNKHFNLHLVQISGYRTLYYCDL